MEPKDKIETVLRNLEGAGRTQPTDIRPTARRLREAINERIKALQAEVERLGSVLWDTEVRLGLEKSAAEAKAETMRAALKSIVDDFEGDFEIEGCVVDDPPTSFVSAWRTARRALAAGEVQHGHTKEEDGQ